MATSSVEQDITLTKAEKEKQEQEAAAQVLYQRWPLPANVSDMKNYAWGKFTWRDVIASGAALLLCIVITAPLQLFLPQWVQVILGAVLALPLIFVINKHHFSGDLPIEDRVKIAVKDRGQANLLFWDKTKKPAVGGAETGEYVSSSTQSFVPDLTFGEDNVVFIGNNEGGFTVIEVIVDDMTMSKHTDMNHVVSGFNAMLNGLINDAHTVPIQIMLKSVPKNLTSYIEHSIDDVLRIETDGKYVMAARAEDYAALLQELDKEKAFYYKYYIVISYRDDAESVGDDTMNSASVRRDRLKEKANPFTKKMEAVESADFDIGDDRKAKLAEIRKENVFGKDRTRRELNRRTATVMNFLRSLGSTHTEVKPRVMDKHEITSLFYQCYNETDKNLVDNTIAQAIEPKVTLYSANVYRDFPDLFAVPTKKVESKTKQLQSRGIMPTSDERMQ